MKIAIVDDISEERTLLRNRLESQFSRRNVHTDIFEYEFRLFNSTLHAGEVKSAIQLCLAISHQTARI